MDVVRFVLLEEWDEVIVGCLHEQGFPEVSVGSTGGVTYSDIPDAQLEAFAVANYRCSAAYPLDPKYSQPLTDEILGKLYDYSVGELTACIEVLGYTISTPPSRQAFIEKYMTDNWSPFAEAAIQAMGRGSDASRQLYEECPEVPVDIWD